MASQSREAFHNNQKKIVRKNHPFLNFLLFILVIALTISTTFQINIFSSQASIKSLIVEKVTDDFSNHSNYNWSIYGINRPMLKRNLIQPVVKYEVNQAYNGQNMSIPKHLISNSVNKLSNESTLSGTELSSSINENITPIVIKNINQDIQNKNLNLLKNIYTFHKLNNLVILFSAILFILLLIFALFKRSFWRSLSLGLFSAGLMQFIIGMGSLFVLSNLINQINADQSILKLLYQSFKLLLNYVSFISFIEICLGMMVIIIRHIFKSSNS